LVEEGGLQPAAKTGFKGLSCRARSRYRAAMHVALDIAYSEWSALRLDILAQTAIGASLHHLGIDHRPVEISVLACDDGAIAELNADFRGKASPTNVLSWPAEDLIPPALPKPDPDGTLALGDIAISFDTCAREAAAAGKPLDAHVTHLIVHGMLHLLGYDHETEADATVMERLEVEILGNLGHPDPYS
jgi:probable rRNA maturation factor